MRAVALVVSLIAGLVAWKLMMDWNPEGGGVAVMEGGENSNWSTLEALVNGAVMRPVVFRNHSVVRNEWLAWHALRSLEWWRQEVRQVARVAVSDTGLFTFAPTRPLSPALGPNSRKSVLWNNLPRIVQEMHVEEFLRLWDVGPQFVSFSVVLHKWIAAERLMPLFAPMGPFITNSSGSSYSFRLWMASSGSRTYAHYDFSHNMFVQVVGVKRVVLLPPDTVSLHPWTHPHATKPVTSVDIRNHPERLHVTLYPGDVLYIPPFWLHDITTIESSISLAIWSPSGDDVAAERLLEIGVPGSGDLRVAFLWLAAIINRIGNVSVEEFVHTLLNRYREYPELKVGVLDECPKSESPIGRDERARLVIQTDLFDKAVNLVTQISPSARSLLVGNYVEMVALQFCQGKAERIPTWLNCFALWLSGDRFISTQQL